jgi:hypothetical protein
MFTTVRPTLYLVYGPESKRIAFSHIQRISRLSPELAGMSSYVLLNDPQSDLEGETESEQQRDVNVDLLARCPECSDFRDEAGGQTFVEEASILDSDCLEMIFSKSKSALRNADSWRPAIDNGWTVKQGAEPIIVTLIDPVLGCNPDWIKVFKILKKQFGNRSAAECLIDSFNVLLGPRFSEYTNSLPSGHAVFQNFAHAFVQLQSGDYHPESDFAWVPQTVVLDGCLDNGVTLTPGSDLRENVTDIISSLVGLTLTDNSTFSDKKSVRSAGAIRVGIPQLELIRENREKWFRKYFKSEGLGAESGKLRIGVSRNAAVEYIENSKVKNVVKSLAESYLGNVNYLHDEDSVNVEEKLGQLRVGFEKYWTERIQHLPDRISAEREKFNLSQRADLQSIVGEWLKSLTLDEGVKALEIIRGIDNAGLVTHEKTVGDLCSMKVRVIEKLGRYKYSGSPERLRSYSRLKAWIESCQADSGIIREIESEIEAVSKELAIEGEAEPSEEGKESLTEMTLSANKSRILKEKKDLESKLLAQKSSESVLENIVGRNSVSELQAQFDSLGVDQGQSAESIEPAKIEGWSKRAEKRTLSTGAVHVVPLAEDERAVRDQYYESLRRLSDLKVDLSREPDRPLTDAEVSRRESLEKGIESQESEAEALLEECAAARSAVENYQISVNSMTEQSARMLMIKKPIETDLQLAPVYFRFLEYEKASIQSNLKTEENRTRERKKHRKSLFIKQISGVLVAILLVVFLIPTFRPVMVIPSKTLVVSQGKQDLSILLGQRSARVTFPVGTWSGDELQMLINGETVKKERIPSTQVRSFGALFVAGVDDGRLSISTNASTSGFGTMEIAGGSSVAETLGFEVGDSFKAVSSLLYRVVAVIIGLLIGMFFFKRFRDHSKGSTRVIKRLKKELKSKIHELEDWVSDSERLITKAGEARLSLSAVEEGVKAIDEQNKIIEFIQDRFMAFKGAIDRELRITGQSSISENELPSSRKFYSIFTRRDLNETILNNRIREADDRNFQEFKNEWSYSRIWETFSKRGAIADWAEKLNKSADASMKVLLDSTLEKLLTGNPDLLSSGQSLVHTLQMNLRTISELCGVPGLDEEERHFVVTKNDEGNLRSIRRRVDGIWPQGQASFVSDGSDAEMLMIVLRPNLQGRRILSVQHGLPQFFALSCELTCDLLRALGKKMDYLCSIQDMEKLSQPEGFGDGSAKWEDLLRKFVLNLMWHPELENRGIQGAPEFYFSKIRLGSSVSEILFRLAGFGLSSKEANSLSAAMSDKPEGINRVDEQVLDDRRYALDVLFDGHMELIDHEIYRFYGDLRSASNG